MPKGLEYHVAGVGNMRGVRVSRIERHVEFRRRVDACREHIDDCGVGNRAEERRDGFEMEGTDTSSAEGQGGG